MLSRREVLLKRYHQLNTDLEKEENILTDLNKQLSSKLDELENQDPNLNTAVK